MEENNNFNGIPLDEIEKEELKEDRRNLTRAESRKALNKKTNCEGCGRKIKYKNAFEAKNTKTNEKVFVCRLCAIAINRRDKE